MHGRSASRFCASIREFLVCGNALLILGTYALLRLSVYVRRCHLFVFQVSRLCVVGDDTIAHDLLVLQRGRIYMDVDKHLHAWQCPMSGPG
jgi:hypothetical protein